MIPASKCVASFIKYYSKTLDVLKYVGKNLKMFSLQLPTKLTGETTRNNISRFLLLPPGNERLQLYLHFSNCIHP
jgi:hypothetical protein